MPDAGTRVADDLKGFFDRRRVASIGDDVRAAWAGFPRDRFVAEATKGLDALELLDRGRHVARALARHLPQDYPTAVGILLRSLGPPLAQADGNGLEPFRYYPHTVFVAERGLDDFDLSMQAQHALTQRFSCEFSIRPFLEREPERALAVLRAWTRDPSEHVRRLVSEGTRPRLPWAPRLRSFQEDPAPVLDLLERLKDDPSEYVRRSVANNLNDVSKDHPDLVVNVAGRWLRGASPERRKLVLHALRSLVRAGHPGAIRLAGGAGGAKLRTVARIAPKRARIGGSVRIAVDVENAGATPAVAVLSLRVHFVKARGGTAPRSFKLPTVELAPRGSATVSKTVSLRQHTTRTHFPGTHRVEVVVNGEARPVGEFRLLAAS